METFLLEFSHYIVSILCILVCISTAILFVHAVQFEKKLDTLWRSAGFWSMAVAFFLFILERKYPEFAVPAVILEFFGFAAIAKGVQSEPILSHLIGFKEQKKKFIIKTNALILVVATLSIVLPLVLFLLFKYFASLNSEYTELISGYLASMLAMISLVFILLTIRLQIKRYIKEKDNPAARLQNLYPLMGYVALFVRQVFAIFYRLPTVDIVFLERLRMSGSAAFLVVLMAGVLGFIMLGVWAWNFIKYRFVLRTFVLFFAIIVIVASLASAIYTLMLFNVVEQNNFDLMMRAVKTQEYVLFSRSDSALLVARSIATDDDVINNFSEENYVDLLDDTEKYLSLTGVDILRIYTKYGEVFVSPSDIRDKGRTFLSDPLIAYVLGEKKQIKSFDYAPGVLADLISTRALYPIFDANENVIGVVETGFLFDNAFVDDSKAKTSFDVTLFTEDIRSATTLRTKDGVSRWVGTQVTNPEVIDNVLRSGTSITVTEEHLEEQYYSAFRPVQNSDGDIIGMLSVGAPVYELIEETRQQLVSVLLIITFVSMVGSLFGYFIIRSFQELLKKEKNKTEK